MSVGLSFRGVESGDFTDLNAVRSDERTIVGPGLPIIENDPNNVIGGSTKTGTREVRVGVCRQTP